jgi:hypothetical protein
MNDPNFNERLETKENILSLAYIMKMKSSNSRYKSKNYANEAASVVSLTSSSGGYINGRNSTNLELLIDTDDPSPC